jgi:hypothetical protein
LYCIGHGAYQIKGGEADIEDEFEDLGKGFVTAGVEEGCRGWVAGDCFGFLLQFTVLVGVLL